MKRLFGAAGPTPILQRLALALAPFALVLLLARGLPEYLRRHLDLQDVPGPAGMKLVAALSGGTLRVPLLDPLVEPLMSLVGGDPINMAFALSAFGGVAACLGCALGGWALAGRLGALAAGTLAGVFSYGLLLSTLVGPDSLAWGVSWLGVGIVFAGARVGWWGLPLLFLGALLALIGPELKESALPVLPLLLLAPLVAFERRAYVPVVAIVVLGMLFGAPDLLRGWHLFPPGSSLGSVSQATPDVSRIPEGLKVVAGMIGHGWGASPFFHLFVLGTIGALIPGPRHLARLGLWGGGLAIMGMVGIAIGTWTKARFLMLPSMPFFLLAGSGFGILIPRLKRGAPLGVAALAGALLFFWFDSLDLMNEWSLEHQNTAGAAPSTLPSPPGFWRPHHHGRDGLMISDFTATGAVELVALTRSGPDAGVLGVRIRDSREAHLVGAAAAQGLPYLILTPEGCCPDGSPSSACARAVLDKVEESGARLILPRLRPQDSRLPPGPQRMWSQLLIEASDGALRGEAYWWVRDGAGTAPTGAMPCTEGPGAIKLGGGGGAGPRVMGPQGPPLGPNGRPSGSQGPQGPPLGPAVRP